MIENLNKVNGTSPENPVKVTVIEEVIPVC